MRRVAMILCTAATTVMIAGLARAPYYTPPGAGDAMLRFSWRMSVTARENCRPRTPAELDALPVHMRTPEVCTRDSARYALITTIDDAAPDTVHLLRGGVKGDRPLFVLEERTLPPGRHRVRIELLRMSSAGVEILGEIDEVLTLEEGAIRLITLDLAGRLVLRSSAAP